MRMFKFLSFILLSFTLLAITSCGEDDVTGFDSSKLEGTWSKVRNIQVMDVDVVYYTFYPETSYSGRIEEYVSNWPDEGWKITDLNYRVGETMTPYFEKRNIHFYVNRLGFHIVEFWNKYQRGPAVPEDIDENWSDDDEMFLFRKIMTKQ